MFKISEVLRAGVHCELFGGGADIFGGHNNIFCDNVEMVALYIYISANNSGSPFNSILYPLNYHVSPFIATH